MTKLNVSKFTFLAFFSISTLCCAHNYLSSYDNGVPNGDISDTAHGAATGSAQVFDQARFYERRYQFQNPNQKLVDNVGENYDNLYGARNVREVLKGVLYRGGANNKYNKYRKRNNMNPLQDHGIENLCKEGFTRSIYLYETNFESAKKSVSCQSFKGEKNVDASFALQRQRGNQIKYEQITAFDAKNEKKFLKMIFDAINGTIDSPIYMHCWNGWHASGLVSAIALQQFCNWAPDRALDYWMANTDGNSSGYEKVKARIRNFKPHPEFLISPQVQQQVCW